MPGFKKPGAGELRHRVVLQDRSQAADSGGGLAETFAVVAQAWARVDPIFGGRIIQGQQVEEVATHNVTVRYVAGYETTDHIAFGSKVLRVRSILNTDERNQWLEFLCEEIRDTG